MTLSNDIIAELRKLANVPVFMGEREMTSGDSIVISPVKLDELVCMYERLYVFSHTVWRNITIPPDCESTYVIVWMIASENYDVNHFSVPWPGASDKTFVHLWSTIDRLRTMLDTMTSSWLLGQRGPVGYAEAMSMPGAADTYLYPKEIITPPHVEFLSDNMSKSTSTDLTQSYTSLHEFRMSMMVHKEREPIDVGAMIMRNNRAAMRIRSRSRTPNENTD